MSASAINYGGRLKWGSPLLFFFSFFFRIFFATLFLCCNPLSFNHHTTNKGKEKETSAPPSLLKVVSLVIPLSLFTKKNAPVSLFFSGFLYEMKKKISVNRSSSIFMAYPRSWLFYRWPLLFRIKFRFEKRKIKLQSVEEQTLLENKWKSMPQSAR